MCSITLTMSVLTPFIIHATINTALSSVSTIVYYTAGSMWWLGKRVIYGRQPTPEEQQQAIIEKQTKLIEQQTELLLKLQQHQQSQVADDEGEA